jgi:hypothetical protein
MRDVVSSAQSLQDLVDDQRKYVAAVKAFQDECQKQDMLISKLEETPG